MDIITPGSTIGIIGGGQLGRMLAIAAAQLGYHTHIFCPEESCPASEVATKTTTAAYTDLNAIKSFAEHVDVVTLEFENIPHETLHALEDSVRVSPNWQALHISQNRGREKNFFKKHHIETAPFEVITDENDLNRAVDHLGRPCILKTTELGYDGKGQYRINEATDLKSLWNEIAETSHKEWIVEGFVDFVAEVSVISARRQDGKICSFPAVQNIHRNGILDTTIVPANLDTALLKKAKEYTEKVVKSLDLIGLLTVEYFVTNDGHIIANEMAPRPHNSGHWSIDACQTSQFEQCIRAVCGLPLGGVSFSSARMKNLIGNEIYDYQSIMSDPHAKFHHYGKKEAKEGRKMGHVTFVGNG